VENWYDPLFIPYYLAGAKVYDFVASLTHGDTGVPGSYFVGRDEAKYKFPMLKDDGLWGAIVYYDGQMNDARMALHLALTSCQSGACVASRVEVEGILKDKKGKTVGAKVRDKETGEKVRTGGFQESKAL
jgi:glycerol-3-phosphate dehydrogenase